MINWVFIVLNTKEARNQERKGPVQVKETYLTVNNFMFHYDSATLSD